MDRAELERLDRESLVLRAQAAGIRRARVLTRPEIVDELLRLDPRIDEAQLKKTRGFFGRARDLLSRVVERGLHLPDAADRLRAMALGSPLPQVPRPEPQAVPTVTLAEIYAAQGHKARAIETLRRVLEAEPDHGAARALLEKLEAADYVAPPVPPLPPEEDVRLDEIGANLGSSPTEPPPPSPPFSVVANSANADTLAQHEEIDVEEATGADLRVAAAPNVLEATGPVTPRIEDPVTVPRHLDRDDAVAPPSSELQASSRPRSQDFTQDECVAIPVDRDGSYVWWRLTPQTRRSVEELRFVIRAVILMPTWDGPKHITRDVACAPEEGELVLRGLPENAIVRIAVGWIDSSANASNAFVPLAHSPALETTSDRRGLVRWTVAGTERVELEDPNASAIACAAESAARAGLAAFLANANANAGPS